MMGEIYSYIFRWAERADAFCSPYTIDTNIIQVQDVINLIG